MNQRDRLVHLATAPNQPIAEMWSGRLMEAGIRALVQSMGLTAYLGLSTPCRIMVREEQLEDARRILEEQFGEEGTADEDDGEA